MIGLLLRSFFLLGIVSWYSTSVWKFIDDYFRYEYKKYLTDEFKRNKNLQPVREVTTSLPPSVASNDRQSSLPFDDNVQSKTCDNNVGSSPQKLDYHNQQQTNDRQRDDDDGFINYWLEQKSRDNADNNLYCHSKEVKCEDNWKWSASDRHVNCVSNFFFIRENFFDSHETCWNFTFPSQITIIISSTYFHRITHNGWVRRPVCWRYCVERKGFVNKQHSVSCESKFHMWFSFES